MTNREMLDRYKELIEEELVLDTNDAEEILNMGKSLERYIWMDTELETNKKKETQ